MTKEQWEENYREHIHEFTEAQIRETMRNLSKHNLFGAYDDFLQELNDYLDGINQQT